jgi:hypothetical protein
MGEDRMNERETEADVAKHARMHIRNELESKNGMQTKEEEHK